MYAKLTPNFPLPEEAIFNILFIFTCNTHKFHPFCISVF